MIVEDHPQVRAGLRAIIESQEDLAVCCEVENGAQAIKAIACCQPDLILLDLSMPVLSGFEVARVVKETYPEVTILVLTLHEEEDYFYQLIDSGANGYLLKDSSPNDIVSAIRSVVNGGVVLCPTLASGLVERYKSMSSEVPISPSCGSDGSSIDLLSKREREVLELTAQGLTARQVAGELGISSNTVERHRANIMAKLGISNRAQMIRFALESRT